MAQVKPVEYVKSSSTAGFAAPGDKKEINATTAAPIQKDANQGNTKPLDNGQQMYLNKVVNPDEVDYTAAEQREVGKNQINTDGIGDTSSKTKGWAVAGGLTGAATAAATAVMASTTAVLKTEKTAAQMADIPFMPLVAGAMCIAGGVAALLSAKKFDNLLGKRNQFKDQSETIKQTIQNYYDTLSADMNSMSENVQTYEDLSNSKVETFESSTNEITVLTCEMQEAALNGDAKAAEEKQQRIEELKQTQTDDSLESECQSLRDGMSEYDSHYNESLGVADSGTLVANFLKEGKKLNTLAMTFGVILSLASAVGLAALYKPIKAAAQIPWPAGMVAKIMAIAGIAMMVAGIALVGAGGAKMMQKAKQEKACNDKGVEIATKITELQTNAQNQIDTNAATVGIFDETDDTTTTTIADTQQEADKIAQENEKQLQKEMASGDTVTPGATETPGGTGSTSGTGGTTGNNTDDDPSKRRAA